MLPLTERLFPETSKPYSRFTQKDDIPEKTHVAKDRYANHSYLLNVKYDMFRFFR